jgi:hypothetical protein
MSQRSFESDFEESNKPVLDQQPLQRTRKHMPVVEPVIESDLELEDLEIEPSKPIIIPQVTGPNKKTEVIEMKFPIDVKNLIPRDMLVNNPFGSVTTKTYDITCFSSAKYNLGIVGYDIKKDYPGYEYQIYAYRATKRLT